MRAYFFRIMILGLILLAAASFTRAATDFGHQRIDKRMENPGGSHGGLPAVSWRQLQSTGFAQIPGYAPTHAGFLHDHYNGRIFFNGKPVFTVAHADSRIQEYKLQQAFADFGGFHIRLKDTQNVLSFPTWDPYVQTQLERIDLISAVFSNNVAKVTGAYKAITLQDGSTHSGSSRGFFKKSKNRPQGPPEWEEIHGSQPVSSSLEQGKLMDLLNERRSLLFRNGDGLSLAFRALPDGHIQQDLRDAAGAVIHRVL